MADRNALRSCPFCGGKGEVARKGTAKQSTIYACTRCGCRLETGEIWSVPDDWNRRHADVALARENERMRAALQRISGMRGLGGLAEKAADIAREGLADA